MGNSKVILLGAVTLMIGMYTVKIQESDRGVTDIGNARSSEYQSIELAKTGVDLAVTELSLSGSMNATRVKTLLGGSVTYVMTKIDTDNEKVTSTATIGTETRTLVAYLTQRSGGNVPVGGHKKGWSRWATVKVYVQANLVDWKNQGGVTL